MSRIVPRLASSTYRSALAVCLGAALALLATGCQLPTQGPQGKQAYGAALSGDCGIDGCSVADYQSRQVPLGKNAGNRSMPVQGVMPRSLDGTPAFGAGPGGSSITPR